MPLLLLISFDCTKFRRLLSKSTPTASLAKIRLSPKKQSLTEKPSKPKLEFDDVRLFVKPMFCVSTNKNPMPLFLHETLLSKPALEPIKKKPAPAWFRLAKQSLTNPLSEKSSNPAPPLSVAVVSVMVKPSTPSKKMPRPSLLMADVSRITTSRLSVQRIASPKMFRNSQPMMLRLLACDVPSTPTIPRPRFNVSMFTASELTWMIGWVPLAAIRRASPRPRIVIGSLMNKLPYQLAEPSKIVSPGFASSTAAFGDGYCSGTKRSSGMVILKSSK